MIKKRLWHALFTTFLALIIVLLPVGAKVHENLEGLSWSLKCRHLSTKTVNADQIKVIMIDQNSLNWAKENDISWPWPREMYAPIIDFCRQSGAKSLAIDLIFSEDSHKGVADDQALGAAIKRFPQVSMALFPHLDKGNVKSLTMPIKEVSSSVKLFGHVSNTPDGDGVTRRVTPFYQFEENRIPLLGLANVLATKDTVPVDEKGRVLLHFRGNNLPYQLIPAHQVITTKEGLNEDLSKNLKADVFKDKYVFLGVNAVGLKDSVTVPVQDHAASGVLLHALALDNFLAQDFMQEMSATAVFVLFAVTALLVALMISFSVGFKSSVIVSLVSLALPFIVGVLSYQQLFWFPDTLCLILVFITLMLGQTFNFAREGSQRRFLKKHFERRLSPQLVEELLKNPQAFKRGGVTRELTIFFSDIQGFTGISEKLEVSQLGELLNNYLTELTDIIIEEGGYLDKYIGDAIVAFWDAPIEQKDHASMACRAAIRCQERLLVLQQTYVKDYGFELVTRMGLNTGLVRVGFFGSAQRNEYTFLGDTGNLAARLEGANKYFGTRVMLSEDCLIKVNLPNQKFREIGDIRVVGREEAVKVFEPILSDGLSEDDHELYNKALKHLREGNWQSAIVAFEKLPYDKLSQKYLSFLKQKEGSWDGVWDMKEK